MTQQQATEIQGPFTREFSGLDISNSVGAIPVSGSPVFHNCDVSDDGAVVRRRGTALVNTYNINNASGRAWSDTIRTKLGSEYFILSNDVGLLISLMRDDEAVGMPKEVAVVSKSSIWTVPPSSMCFIPVSAPYDRLLILTPEHPIVQLSFLERTLSFTCTTNHGGGVFSFTAPISVNDTTLWRDTNASSYIVTDAAGTVYAMTQKNPDFSFRLSGSFVVGQTYTLTIRQITWQWWAESMYYEGQDMMQNTSRFNVTSIDQNVKIPDRLITDIDPVYKNSQGLGLFVFWSSRFDSNGWAGPTTSPNTADEYGFSGGGRFTPPSLVPGATLQAAPFFITFGGIYSGTPTPINQVNILRLRELRFNGGTGAKPDDLQVYNDTVEHTWNNVPFSPSNFQTWATTYTATDRVITLMSAVGDRFNNANYFAILGATNNLPANAPLHISCLSASSYLGGSRRVWYRNLPTTGGTLDGCYVRAYGIGKYVDYSKRSFHAIGTIYRDRLILVNPSTATDQLLISEIGDATVPGEFYQFMQITDMLQGVTTDPFTLNVTSEGRERITAVTGWQKRLFVFTGSNTYSIEGGEQFGESSYAVNLVSTYGAFNQNCVVVTNLTVLYMNKFGLFDLMNKPNTDSYGAFERSVKIRGLFQNLAGSSGDNLHWLRYNESSNKLYIGLAAEGDTRTTSRNLMLNFTWDSWSTLSSAAPFQMYPAVQLFKYMTWLTNINAPLTVAMLATEMPFYIDFATIRTHIYPFTFCAGQRDVSVMSDSRGIYNLPLPVTPGILDYTITASSKAGAKTYQRNTASAGTETLTLRNPMMDYADTLELLGGNVNASQFAMVMSNGFEPYTTYPTVTYNGVAPLQWTVTGGSGLNNRPILSQNNNCIMGMIYPSVYASPIFDLESLGRLKRLKKLHLQMDTTVTSQLKYNLTSGFSQVSVLNTAWVAVVSNYNENIVPAVVSYQVGNSYEIRRVVELSIPLQGYGCDYQFYIASVGAEAFKLAAYEFDIQPQRDKRYVRR
ncbi:tail protein [Phormidium phage Pf-WMP4]|uniref:PfWMP4_35 n=1 Tax=Phormidium phage Pf-WMP4 TaxID=2913979 RepID=Q0GBT1_9CAUD|nr:tail protein [Phormidium phage Pf-WMP4]ABI33179.1 PfWMP4_35 [Phormidium phage Pf-WMP4]